MKNKSTSSEIPQSVDLFCGAGGLSYGLSKAGINVQAGYDIDPFCRFPYEQNNKAHFFLRDVSTLNGDDLNEHFDGSNGPRILAGCAPCQPFSSYTQAKEARKDRKWGLIGEFARLVEESTPDVVTMENVPTLKQHDIFWDFTDRLEDMGYFVSFHVVFCPDYGMPQIRKRLVLFASKHSKIELTPPTHRKNKYKTVRAAIGGLPRINAGEKCGKDVLHVASGLTEKNLKRIQSSTPGGTWRDWPEELIANCHKSESGKTYPGVYGRMEWDKPSPTITTQCFGFGNGRFGHPDQDRAITLREAAILQTFPKKYQFCDPNLKFSITAYGRLIGNAVPVRLGHIVGRSIINHLDHVYGKI